MPDLNVRSSVKTKYVKLRLTYISLTFVLTDLNKDKSINYKQCMLIFILYVLKLDLAKEKRKSNRDIEVYMRT